MVAFGAETIAHAEGFRLVAEGADLDASAADGDRAVACAAYNGRWDSVDFLVSRGVAVEVDTRSGKTVLQWAQQLRSPWVVASIRRAISLRPRPRSDESP